MVVGFYQADELELGDDDDELGGDGQRLALFWELIWFTSVPGVAQ